MCVNSLKPGYTAPVGFGPNPTHCPPLFGCHNLWSICIFEFPNWVIWNKILILFQLFSRSNLIFFKLKNFFLSKSVLSIQFVNQLVLIINSGILRNYSGFDCVLRSYSPSPSCYINTFVKLRQNGLRNNRRNGRRSSSRNGRGGGCGAS